MKTIFVLLCSFIATTCIAQDNITFENSQASSTTSQTATRILQFENEKIRAWKTIIMPNQPIKMHRHDSARLIVTLKGGNLAKVDADGTLTNRIFETGESYWLEKDPPNALHACVNKSDTPIEVIVIEMK
jgi:quercetin dioxygenase-like cupin family protein